MAQQKRETFWQNFRRFFFRGLAILLPSVLTFWLLIAAYNFVDETIAEPINAGVREVVLQFSSYPEITDDEVLTFKAEMDPKERNAWTDTGASESQLKRMGRREKLLRLWRSARYPLDLVGLFLAVMLIYLAGGFLGSFIGKRIYQQGEGVLNRLPILRSVYPSIKQVTDFLVGEKDEIQFSQVIAVEYPRKGIWSLGLVTGETMQTIQDAAGDECMTVFIPSSPTPFTGYVLTVPRKDTVELPISIDDALRFTISGGVVVPLNQMINKHLSAGQLGKLKGDTDESEGDAASTETDKADS